MPRWRGGPKRACKSIWVSMSELTRQVETYLDDLRRGNASRHTIRNYTADLRQFVEYLTPADGPPPDPAALDVLSIRDWLGSLYARGLSPVTIRRKMATVRSLLQFLVRNGVIEVNRAKLVGTPKTPQTLPRVPSAEQTNTLLDSAAAMAAKQPKSERDLAILELLYGCGVRVGELVGLNLADLNLSDGWLRVRGKGRKERQTPVPSKALSALNRYLAVRNPAAAEAAVFLNRSGRRLSDRSVRAIVKKYAVATGNDPALHPHSFRHAYATHLLGEGADLRSIQELLGHAQLSTTQKYTQLSLTELMAVYDNAHPKAK